MDEALRQLYEQAVPEPVREYLDAKAATAVRPRRPPRSSQPRQRPDAPAPSPEQGEET